MIDKQFLVERQGRTFALYAGLLDAAHHDGLKRISTTLLQAGSDANNQTWIVAAEVETARGVFSGIGDASPANVNRQMVNCLPRMAETRSKARALRDAVNAGALVAVEELGDDADAHQEPPAPAKLANLPPPAKTDAPATDSQLRAIARLGGKITSRLTEEQAGVWIRQLQVKSTMEVVAV